MSSKDVDSSSGLSLIEVLIAMALATLICAGLFPVGLTARRFAEDSRLATEARLLAKERLEEMISVGRLNLVKPSCTLINASTNLSSQGYSIVQQPQIVWHAADRTVVDAAAAVYAEAHVDVTYRSPLLKRPSTDTYSTIIQ
jgi:prepilin-type N-terminal cleavage/methylation domain-containing protein